MLSDSEPMIARPDGKNAAMLRLDGLTYYRQYMNLSTAALTYGYSCEYLALLIRRAAAGKTDRPIRAYKVGRKWRINILDFIDYVNAQQRPAERIIKVLKQKPALLKQKDSEIAQMFSCSVNVVYRARSEAGLHKNRRPAAVTQLAA